MTVLAGSKFPVLTARGWRVAVMTGEGRARAASPEAVYYDTFAEAIMYMEADKRWVEAAKVLKP